MQTKNCAHCHNTIDARSTYCESCKEKIRSGEIEMSRHIRWYYRHPDRVYQRSKDQRSSLTSEEIAQRRAYNTEYVKRQRLREKREKRHAFVAQEREQGTIICFRCEGPIPSHRIKKCRRDAPPKYCSRPCANADLHEKNLITGFYQRVLSTAGNRKLTEIAESTGVRPGAEKRRRHARSLHEARRHGKRWKKTGPKRSAQ